MPDIAATEPEAASQPRRRPATIVLITGLLLIWQILFWPALHFAETAARPTNPDLRPTVAYQYVSADGQPLADGVLSAARNNAPVGYYVQEASDAPRVRFIVPFNVSDPSQPLALLLAVRNSVDVIRLNGQIVQYSGAPARHRGLVTSEPGLTDLPASLLKPGANQLEIETPNFGSQWLSEFSIGPSAPLAETYRWKTRLQVDIPLAGFAVLLFTIVLCLVTRWPAEDRSRMRALTVLLATCAASSYLLTFNPPIELSVFWTVFFYVLSNYAIAIGLLAYAMIDARTEARQARLFRFAWAAAPVASLAGTLGAQFIGPAGAWLRQSINVSFAVVIVVGVLALILLARALVIQRGVRWFERSALAVCVLAFIVDRLGTIVPLTSPFDPELQLTLGLSPIVSGLLGLSIVVAIAREATEARRVVSSANDVLRTRIAAREAELGASHAREQEAQKRAVLLEERQRIVRDVHDGIGGQLLGLCIQVKAGRFDNQGLGDALQASLSDLRLIVDSLDSAEDGLVDLLYAFERRARAQAESAGCVYESKIDISPETPGLGPRGNLQTLRILQEGLANSLQHAKAKSITLNVRIRNGRLHIELRDDGVGFHSASLVGGHGLSSMKSRAASIGAHIRIDSGSPGTSLLLDIPFAAGDVHVEPALTAQA